MSCRTQWGNSICPVVSGPARGGLMPSKSGLRPRKRGLSLSGPARGVSDPAGGVSEPARGVSGPTGGVSDQARGVSGPVRKVSGSGSEGLRASQRSLSARWRGRRVSRRGLYDISVGVKSVQVKKRHGNSMHKTI